MTEVADAELVCLAVAQARLGFGSERRWLRAAPKRVGHLFPHLLSQPAFAEIPTLIMLVVMAARWIRSEQRAARAAERDGDARLAAQNAYLAEPAES